MRQMKLSLYTFADEAFVPAIAALVNSARRNGFSGTIHIGSPEPLSISRQIPEGIKFHSLGPSDYWPGNQKTELLLKHPSEHVVLLDAEIIIADPTCLSRLEKWATQTICAFRMPAVPRIDYRRYAWSK